MIVDSSIPKWWFDKDIALKVVRAYFQAGQELIRIATGFFTVRGYNLIRGSARGKRMYILVGLDDPGKDRVQKALVEEIMRDLGTGIDVDRREAVRELVEKMEGGEFRIIDARAKDHHAKLFIIDRSAALVGSSNVSQRGMLDAIEDGNVVEDLNGVEYFLAQFDKHFFAPDAIDITQELIEALRRWLGMQTPWDIYLRTLLALKDLEDFTEERPTFRKPVGYQNDVIARLLRQVDEYDGAMLVASTGLGKTVIAADVARRLRKGGKIDNVLVIGPEPVRDSWRFHLRPAGLTPEFYNHSALDVTDYQYNQHSQDLDDVLENYLDKRWLIILDESHELRNRFQEKWKENELITQERKAFDRLRRAVDRSRCKVLLLTATPYAKEVKNVNNQMYLLPHSADSSVLFPELADSPNAWHIHELRDLRESPPVSVITTPYVARYYGTREDKHIFIDFNGQKKYLPQVVLYAAQTPVLIEDAMTAALDNYAFKQGPTRGRYQPIEVQARVAWASSPWALRDVVEQSLADEDDEGYEVQFLLDSQQRSDFLVPILQTLKDLKFRDDPKLMTLVEILKSRKNNGEKIIIFVERLPTTAYLEEAIKTLLPDCRVANLVEKKKNGYRLKKKPEVKKILGEFAPIANRKENTENSYDILIATDAYGVGINLEDASVVINYDLAWTSIEPDQRAGRILRFWECPREVSLYIFIPFFEQENYRHESSLVLARWERLLSRHQAAKTVLEMPTITQQDQQKVDLQALAGKQTIQRLGEIDLGGTDIEVEQLHSSEVFQHTAVLIQHRDYAKTISDDIISAMVYPGKDLLLYILLFVRGHFEWMLYDVKRRHLQDRVKDIELLDLIKSDQDTPTAMFDPNHIEYASDACIRLWCKQKSILPEEVSRICAMMLVPQSMGDEVSRLFE